MTARQKQFADAGLDWLGRSVIGEALFDYGELNNLQFLLDNTERQQAKAILSDKKRGTEYRVVTTSRRMGEDNGKAQVVYVSDYLKQIRAFLKATTRPPSPDETSRYLSIIQSEPPVSNEMDLQHEAHEEWFDDWNKNIRAVNYPGMEICARGLWWAVKRDWLSDKT